jgi:hypothetical protein
MGAMTALTIGMGAISAGTKIITGHREKKEAERNAQMVYNQSVYNAGIFRQQASMVEDQKNLKAQQDARKIRFMAGKHVAMTAAKGLEYSGSPIAVLVDTLTQLEMDKAINTYNYEVEQYGLESKARETELRGYTLAESYREGGKTALLKGYMGGLSTMAATAVYAGKRWYTAKQAGGGATKAAGLPSFSFDLDAGAKKGTGV